VRLVLTILQAVNGGKIFDQNEQLHRFVYFELPNHIFNIVAYIVLMQW
jgi:hypothetical protein